MNRIKSYVIAPACVVAITLSLTACKGRTMENMEPLGDTVEVVVNSETPDDPDSGQVLQSNDRKASKQVLQSVE